MPVWCNTVAAASFGTAVTCCPSVPKEFSWNVPVAARRQKREASVCRAGGKSWRKSITIICGPWVAERSGYVHVPQILSIVAKSCPSSNAIDHKIPETRMFGIFVGLLDFLIFFSVILDFQLGPPFLISPRLGQGRSRPENTA